MSSPIWLDIASSYIGQKEIHGAKHNMTIVEFWRKIHLNAISNDEVPWCASFVGACLEEAGVKSTRSGLAKSYLKWGQSQKSPMLGSIVVFTRSGGGHVGFAAGQDKRGNLYILGGNQSDAVNIKLFTRQNVVGYRWPLENTQTSSLPVLSSPAEFETKVT